MTGDWLRRSTAALLVAVATSGFAQSDEERVGRAGAALILGAAALSDSQSALTYVNTVGYSVAQFSGANYQWHFGVVKSEAINAFAMPGGYILLSAGLLKALESEDELAFVLAHEVAHVTRRHHYQVLQRQRMAEQASKGLQAVTQEGDTAKLALASGQIYARGLDKTAEFESDRLGAEYMTRAGYDPAAALNVLEKLQRFKGDDPRAELLFSTHPAPADRMDRLVQAGIEKLPRPPANPSPAVDARFKACQKSL